MARLTTFSGTDLADLGERIRGFARSSTSMEDAARQIVALLDGDLRDEAGKPGTRVFGEGDDRRAPLPQGVS